MLTVAALKQLIATGDSYACPCTPHEGEDCVFLPTCLQPKLWPPRLILAVPWLGTAVSCAHMQVVWLKQRASGARLAAEDVVAHGVGDVVGQVVQRRLARHRPLAQEAQERQHGQAAVAHLRAARRKSGWAAQHCSRNCLVQQN